jgi:signal transduction histidine kinase
VKVFCNLMDNSLRHGVHVTRMDYSVREAEGNLILMYHDDGVGILPEDKKQLFQKGFGHHTGLGLFLSKEILSITGITISENGEPGKGVRIEITVPREAYRQISMP